MFDVGRICYKIAGRDAGKIAVVVQKIDEKNVMIEGDVRRRKCNINHLELTNKIVKVSENADKAAVAEALKAEDIVIEVKETKKKQAAVRPKKQKVKHEKQAKPAKAAKKADKPVAKKATKTAKKE